MERAVAHPLPTHDPVSGGSLVITELEGPESSITIRGRFEVPRFARLSPDQSRFLETFLRCRGMLNSVEKELGISYPTARARLDAVLRVLDLANGQSDLAPPPDAPAPPTPPVPPGEIGSSVQEPAAPEDVELDKDIFEEEEAMEEEAEETPSEPRRSAMEILDAIESGDITPEDAKRELGTGK